MRHGKVEDSMEKYVGDPMQRFVDEKKGKLSVKIGKVKRPAPGMPTVYAEKRRSTSQV